MKTIYNLLTKASQPVLKILGQVNPKIRAFVKGREQVFEKLTNQIVPTDNIIWVHCASLGEYEQGLPIIKELQRSYPKFKILLTFFSPSGYDVRKNSPFADVISYLPLDTAANAKKFMDITRPKLAVFVKYEFWPNYYEQLKRYNIPTLLVSGVFRPDQVMFKSYGAWLKSSLNTVTHFFVQNQASYDLLHKHGFTNVSLSGDTRFDRVSAQIEVDNRLDFMDTFVGNSECIVIGSSWPEDEALFLDFVNDPENSDLKFVIAPHQIEASKTDALTAKIKLPYVQFSKMDPSKTIRANVLILDTIGLLTKVYSYATIAYVGGAMGTSGLHNILEPATFGIPIIVGQNYQKFPEAVKLRELAGLYSVQSKNEFEQLVKKLLSDTKFREKTGMICGHFVNSNTGATRIVTAYIANLHSDGLI